MRFILIVALAGIAASQDRMTPELLWKLRRIDGGQISPDGKQVLYGVRVFDLAANQGDTDLYVVPLAGGAPRPLSSGEGSESDAQWVATKGGLRVFCIARRDGGQPQVWSIDPASGSWAQVTSVEGGVANLKVSPDGTAIAFTRDVKLDSSAADLYPDLPKADARIIDSLMYRHWNEWHDFAYSHVHVARLAADGTAGPAIDLMENLRADCPMPPFGGKEQFSWSPDGKLIAYTAKLSRDPARSTDSNVYLRSVEEGGSAECLSPGMEGYDLEPTFSPDGRYVAFLSMARGGFEADRSRIMVFDREHEGLRELEGVDRSAHELRWSPDGQSIYFKVEVHGREQVARVAVEGDDTKVTYVTSGVADGPSGVANWALRDISADGETLLLARQDMLRPIELWTMKSSGDGQRPLTRENEALLANVAKPRVEERWVRSSDGARVHCWVVLPPDFDPKKRYPMLTFCQGGPQSQIGQAFSYRWNFHLMASNGYVVLAPNRRGVPGFGQDWVDQISGDWGGQAMQDILAATDSLAMEPWIDAARMAAVGASFGGYTVYWLMGNAENRFCAMIAPCGVFNLESMYGSTEELFFVDWDLGGPYWRSNEVQALYDRFSPHRFAGSWRTPLLVIHGEKDFRVPVTQGMEAFTAAQIEGVPSRFLYFPNEGHWVMSPQNSVLWQRVFFDWLERHCKGTR